MAVKTMTVKRPEEIREVEIQRPERVKLTSEEALRRMQEFTATRKEKLVATVRKDKN